MHRESCDSLVASTALASVSEFTQVISALFPLKNHPKSGCKAKEELSQERHWQCCDNGV